MISNLNRHVRYALTRFRFEMSDINPFAARMLLVKKKTTNNRAKLETLKLSEPVWPSGKALGW